jgi:hypothetical protein
MIGGHFLNHEAGLLSCPLAVFGVLIVLGPFTLVSSGLAVL